MLSTASCRPSVGTDPTLLQVFWPFCDKLKPDLNPPQPTPCLSSLSSPKSMSFVRLEARLVPRCWNSRRHSLSPLSPALSPSVCIAGHSQTPRSSPVRSVTDC
ncbi:hypothetical protein DPEC_G00291050 [Dallia pectoralis]|uniref:Uncharacterized protein n=1 Tax=Dallia pectoralis TaxID=75939 RepID=A0ACC2FHJ5_DALPE|nr:hypothetical protein DPEC_G00291050 [Dallia pectoralis]